jgi:hypothetical protein
MVFVYDYWNEDEEETSDKDYGHDDYIEELLDGDELGPREAAFLHGAESDIEDI